MHLVFTQFPNSQQSISITKMRHFCSVVRDRYCISVSLSLFLWRHHCERYRAMRTQFTSCSTVTWQPCYAVTCRVAHIQLRTDLLTEISASGAVYEIENNFFCVLRHVMIWPNTDQIKDEKRKICRTLLNWESHFIIYVGYKLFCGCAYWMFLFLLALHLINYHRS